MSQPPQKENFFTLLWSALKGGNHEYTSGSINRAIFMLSVPMIAEMIMESLFAVIDMYFVEKVSVDALAVVGLTEAVLFVIYSIGMGLSIAVTAIVARRVGEKEHKRAADAAFQAILLALGIGIPLGIAGYLFAGDVLALMGESPALVEEGTSYAQVIYGSNIVILLLFMINAIFRGAGNAAIAMRSLWIANGLNIILDPILIFGLGPFPEMGVLGAAVATTTGRGIGVLYQLYHLFNGNAIVKLAWSNIVVRMQTMQELIKVGASGAGQFLIESASWIFLVKIVALFGSEAIAGYTITFRIIIFTLLPSFGVANAAATLVGQNLGAKEPERAEKSVWRAAIYNTIYLFFLSAVFFIFAYEIIGIFTQVESVRAISTTGLQIICLGYIFFSYGMVLGQAFNGAGDTRTPMWISLVVFWLIQIPLSYWMSVMLDLQTIGVFASISIAHSLYAIIAAILFRRGKWKLVEV